MRTSRKPLFCECCGKLGTYAKGLCKSCYGRKLRTGSPQKVERACKERDDQIVEMRRNGATYDEIAAKIGISKQRVYVIFNTHYKATNGDRIRKMTDENLAKYLAWLEDPQSCYVWELYENTEIISEWLEWLKQECES